MRVSSAPGTKPSGAAHRRNRSEPISPELLANLPKHVRGPPLRFELPQVSALADWTSRSRRLLGCTLGILIVLAFVAVPSGEGGATHFEGSRLKEPVLLHQTVPSLNMSSAELSWRHSWERLGFQLQIADDARCREHIMELALLTRQPKFLQVYDALDTGVQRADMWRYAVLYLYGGVYADVDVLAKPQMADLVNDNLNRSGVVFVESLPSPWLIGFIARFLYVTDMVRVPQYRNCIMIARRRLPAMRMTLENIVNKFLEPPAQRQPEPTYTLELTGPGIFTDSVKAAMGSPLDPPGSQRNHRFGVGADAIEGIGARRDVTELVDLAADGLLLKETGGEGGSAPPGANSAPMDGREEAEEAEQEHDALLHISRLAGHRYFEHVGRGSWKVWRGPDVRGWRSMISPEEDGGKKEAPQKRALDPHEVRLMALIILVILAIITASVSTTYGRQLCSTYCKLRNGTSELLHQASASLRAKLNVVLPEQRRAMLSHRLIQCLALLVAVSGLRSQCGARCLNPWRVVGFWLYLFERRVVPRSEPSEPQLGRIATGSQLAVVGCGRTLGSALITSGTIEAVEQIGSYFKTYEVHLLLQLVVRERDNTRNALYAWAVRNPRVVIHKLLVETVKSLPASSRTSLGDGPQGALLDIYKSGVATAHALPSNVGYVLMLDTETPHPFSSAALLEALTWSSHWDAVCAAAMEADGIIRNIDLANHGDRRPSRTNGFIDELPSGGAPRQTRSGAVPVQSCASALVMYRRTAWRKCTAVSKRSSTTEDPSRASKTIPWSREHQLDMIWNSTGLDAEPQERTRLSRASAAASLSIHGGFGGAACERAQLHRCMAARGHGQLFILPSLAIRHSDPQQDLLYVLLTLAILLPAIVPCVAFCKRRLICGLPRPRCSFFSHLGLQRVCATLTTGRRLVRARKRVLLVLTIVVLFQVVLLCRRLHHSAAAALAVTSSAYDGAPDEALPGAREEGTSLLISFALLVIPMAISCLTAIDLLLSPSCGSLAFRVPTAALTVLVPLFVLLELRRLQAIELPEPAGEDFDHSDGRLLLAARDLAAWLRQPWPNSLGLCRRATTSCGAQ